MKTLALVSALAIGAASHSIAAEAPQQRTIIVSGEGEVLARPDQARITAAVVTQAVSAQAAAEGNAAAMTRVMTALSGLGIVPAKIQTSNYSVQPQYSGAAQRVISGYQASNQITIVIDDLPRLGVISDALVRSGANQMGGVAFAVADPKPLENRAREAAVADAAAKARTLASAAGVKLGPLLTIQEGPAPFRAGPFVAQRALEAGVSTPIMPGEQPITAIVTMTFSIQ